MQRLLRRTREQASSTRDHVLNVVTRRERRFRRATCGRANRVLSHCAKSRVTTIRFLRDVPIRKLRDDLSAEQLLDRSYRKCPERHSIPRRARHNLRMNDFPTAATTARLCRRESSFSSVPFLRAVSFPSCTFSIILLITERH